MKTNKRHKIFGIQLAIATVILFGSKYVMNKAFMNTSASEDYLIANNNITNIRKSSSDVLNKLISEDELTFDPTSGVSIKKVFDNLKVTNKRKVLLLGSSQLVTVSGDKSFDNYKRRTDKLLEKLYDDQITVYNLSLGGMTVAEKEIILKKTQELYTFDAIVVSIGPYDCRESDIRQSIRELQNIKFEPRVASKSKNSGNKASDKTHFSIIAFNNAINTNVTELLAKNSGFYKNKSAIKSWLFNETANYFIEKKEVKSSKEPNGWWTFNQTLTTKTGWVSTESELKSLKLINRDGGNANWKGVKVNLKKPTNKIKLSGLAKSENAKGAKLFCLDFKVEFTDGTHIWYYKGLSFDQGTNNWMKVEKEITFDKEISAITPTLLFYGGTGTVWFDNIQAKPVYNGVADENIIINSSIDEEKAIKDVHILTFDEKVWNNVFENAQKLTAYFGKHTNDSTKKYLLIPPVYNSIQQNGYAQKFYTDKYKSKLLNVCTKEGITLLDAGKLLNEDNFIEYQSGERKGMIEPLHFNGNGHHKLAKYLYEKLQKN